MSLPADGVNANTLAETTTIPTGKKLIFLDPDTNEGGIITLENLTKQILSNLTSQTFNLDQGNKTLLAALNELNSKKPFSNFEHGSNSNSIAADVSKAGSASYGRPFAVTVCDWGTGGTYLILGTYRGANEKQMPSIATDTLGGTTVSFEDGVLTVTLSERMSYLGIYY